MAFVHGDTFAGTDYYKAINPAFEKLKKRHDMRFICDLHSLLQKSASHYTLSLDLSLIHICNQGTIKLRIEVFFIKTATSSEGVYVHKLASWLIIIIIEVRIDCRPALFIQPV